MNQDMSAPIRLCCMQSHFGPQCPDGKVMCCYCFNRFDVEDLAVIDGAITNVCKPCRYIEEAEMKKRGLL